jgi:small subunit ribosomal protein S18
MARARTNTRRKTEERDRRPKKKISILDQERVDWIDYKDVNLLRRFMSERAKIRARRVTGNDAQQQRTVARAIRIAREMALLPYSVRQVTHRSKGKGGRGDRGDRGELSAANMTAPGPPTAPPRGEGSGSENIDGPPPVPTAPPAQPDAPSVEASEAPDAPVESIDAGTGAEAELAPVDPAEELS